MENQYETFVIITGLVVIFFYMLPSVIAFCRRHHYRWIIFILNIFGFTGIVWVVAFIWSVWPKNNAIADPIMNDATGNQIRTQTMRVIVDQGSPMSPGSREP